MKKTTSVKISDEHKRLLRNYFGSLGKALSYLADLIDPAKKELRKDIDLRIKTGKD